MTVKELIDNLKQFDENKEVTFEILEDYLNDDGELYDRIISSKYIYVEEKEGEVILSGYTN